MTRSQSLIKKKKDDSEKREISYYDIFFLNCS